MTTAWDAPKVQAFRDAFRDFLSHVKIYSKDEIGETLIQLLGSQRRFLNEIFEGLERDIHFFVILKARQLGISTVTRVLILFWAFMHPGLRIALVYDNEANKEEARRELRNILDHLPPSHRIPVRDDNKDFMEFGNDARIALLVAGMRKSKTSGGLGRSRGINCVGATEVSSWGDVDGLRSFERSLSDKHENRLYIWESTARGPNIFKTIWDEAVADDITKKAIFIGWWAHEGYSVAADSPLFARYGFAPSVDEQKKIDEVSARYGHEVTIEQLAWYRHQHDPNVDHSDDERAGQDIIQQELPWTEDEAFLRSGDLFFLPEKIFSLQTAAKAVRPVGYRYDMTDDFFETRIDQAPNLRHAQLKVWEEPEPNGVYCIGADPLGASSEEHKRHSLQVIRCYADGFDQVAEYVTGEGDARNFAWVILHLCGAYGGQTKGARFLLELNGVGNSVWNEIKTMIMLLRSGYLRISAQERGLTNIMDNVRNFLWTKDDMLSQSPSAFHWETNTKRKIMIMESLRSQVHVSAARIRSLECLNEMVNVIREGDKIEADGDNTYDRVMPLALAVRAWEAHERKPLILKQSTRSNTELSKHVTGEDLQRIFSQNIVQSFFAQQRRDRIERGRAVRRGGRWNF